MTLIPENPDARLTRDHTAAALTEAGFPVKPKTLATKASRGGGPPYQLFGVRPLYRWGDAIAWAQSKLSKPRHTSSEADVERADLLPLNSGWARATPPKRSTAEADATTPAKQHHDRLITPTKTKWAAGDLP